MLLQVQKLESKQIASNIFNACTGRLRNVQHRDAAETQREQLQGGVGNDTGADEYGMRGAGLAS